MSRSMPCTCGGPSKVTRCPIHASGMLSLRGSCITPPLCYSSPKNLRHHEGRSTGCSGAGEGVWPPVSPSLLVRGQPRASGHKRKGGRSEAGTGYGVLRPCLVGAPKIASPNPETTFSELLSASCHSQFIDSCIGAPRFLWYPIHRVPSGDHECHEPHGKDTSRGTSVVQPRPLLLYGRDCEARHC